MMDDSWVKSMTIERMIKEAYRRGGGAMFDMMRGGLHFSEAWRRLGEAAAMETPPNLRDLIEGVQARGTQ
jgi:hypothetical protein